MLTSCCVHVRWLSFLTGSGVCGGAGNGGAGGGGAGLVIQRGQFGEERYEKVEFQKTVREKFMNLRETDESEANVPWFVLDARKSIDELHAEIRSIAEAVVTQNEGAPVKKLWT